MQNYNLRCLPKSKTAVLFVGFSGNNATTFLSAMIAKKLRCKWETKDSSKLTLEMLGSISEYGRFSGDLDTGSSEPIYYSDMFDMLNVDDMEISGWDIDDTDAYTSVKRNKVIDPGLREKISSHLQCYVPMQGIYYSGWIANNQDIRLKQPHNFNESKKQKDMEYIRECIRSFKKKYEKVIVLLSISTERNPKSTNFDTAEDIIKALENSDPEISPSMIYLIASVLEGCIFVNCCPQNLYFPGIYDLAERNNAYLLGNDLKTGQTRIKSVFTDFLVKSGIKPLSIISYNHLGNNDGLNLSSQTQFQSKEVSKSEVITDLIESNPKLFGNEKPEHTVVIKYIKAVGDEKRAIDEYYCELPFGEKYTMLLYNICPDSVLACGVIYDIIRFSDLLSRVEISNSKGTKKRLNPVLNYLSIFFKAPVVNKGEKVVNAYFTQYRILDSFLRRLANIPEENLLNLDKYFE